MLNKAERKVIRSAMNKERGVIDRLQRVLGLSNLESQIAQNLQREVDFARARLGALASVQNEIAAIEYRRQVRREKRARGY